MTIYEEVLNNKEYKNLVEKIEKIKLITDGKWDWEHGLGHFKRVAEICKEILLQLNADNRTIDLAMSSALLHDIGIVKGNKKDHALESAEMFYKYIEKTDLSFDEIQVMREAIADHSKGNKITSLVGLSLVLADKLDINYHRTINSSIKDYVNTEVLKINNVDIIITDNDLTVRYNVVGEFDVDVLKSWDKSITIPKKISTLLDRNFVFLVNDKEINYESILSESLKV